MRVTKKLPIFLLVNVFTFCFAAGAAAQAVSVFYKSFEDMVGWSVHTLAANYNYPDPDYQPWSQENLSTVTNLVVNGGQVGSEGGSVCSTLTSPTMELGAYVDGNAILRLRHFATRRNWNYFLVFDGHSDPFSYGEIAAHRASDDGVLWQQRLFESLDGSRESNEPELFDLPRVVREAGTVYFTFRACAGITGHLVGVFEEPHASLLWQLLDVEVTATTENLVTLDASTYQVQEGGTAAIKLTRSGSGRGETLVRVGTQEAGDHPATGCHQPPGYTCDYLYLDNPQHEPPIVGGVDVAWADGEVGTKTVQIQTRQDDFLEGPETFGVVLSWVRNAYGDHLGEPSTATVTITDDNPEYDSVPDWAHQPLDFGTVNIGETVQKDIRVGNKGYGAFRVTGVEIEFEFYPPDYTDMHPGAFTLLPGSCNGATLYHGSYCVMHVRFTPTRKGAVVSQIVIQTQGLTPSQSSSQGINLAGAGADVVPPATTAMVSPAPNAAGWNNSDTTVALDATDNAGGAGVKEIVYQLSGAQPGGGTVAGSSASVVIVAEGTTEITYFARDTDGNEEPPQSVTVRVDTRGPEISCAASPQPNLRRWNNTDVTVTFTATDATSGLDAVPDPVVVSSEGADQQISRSVTDRAGNSASASCRVSLDKTPPTVTGTRAPQANAAGWNNTDVTVTFTCADGLSGVQSCGPTPQLLSVEGAGQSAAGQAFDAAGNAASALVDGINIDKTPPSVSCAAAPGVLWPANHKMVPVQVTLGITDAASGAGGMSLTSVTSNEPDDGQGDGDTAGDIQGFVPLTPDTVGFLRAERSGRGTGRLYTFTYTGADAAGNRGSCQATVVVPHSRGK